MQANLSPFIPHSAGDQEMIPFLLKSEGSLRLQRGKVDVDKTVFPGGVK